MFAQAQTLHQDYDLPGSESDLFQWPFQGLQGDLELQKANSIPHQVMMQVAGSRDLAHIRSAATGTSSGRGLGRAYFVAIRCLVKPVPQALFPILGDWLHGIQWVHASNPWAGIGLGCQTLSLLGRGCSAAGCCDIYLVNKLSPCKFKQSIYKYSLIATLRVLTDRILFLNQKN